jgi:type I phosphodiesterase/nucleotide pyrophosphatase
MNDRRRMGAWAATGVACLLVASLRAGTEVAPAPGRPRLLLLIAVDQMRYDYLTRFRDRFSRGFAQLLREGAVFTNATLQHYPTVTAVGHSTMLTGATPALSGIVGNDWYDRATGRSVTSVSDPAVRPLGGEGPASSPSRLLVSTVGDELKMAGRRSRVIGLSFKDRSAILPAGRMADGAFWQDPASRRFVSSTWYFAELPSWVTAFNARRIADSFAGAEWKAPDGRVLRKMPPAPGPELNAAIAETPFGNELLEAFAEAALEGEKLGQGEGTDVLTVSFSANDWVGHKRGPDSPELADITVRTDQVVGALFAAVERNVGLARTVVVLTADHGVAPVPELMAQRRMPGGRMTTADLAGPVAAALSAAYGPGKWVEGTAGSELYLNRTLIAHNRLDERDVERRAARVLADLPHVMRVYTREQLLDGAAPPDPPSQRVLRGFHPQRSGDVGVVLEPYWMREDHGTTHGSPYSYDAHIPLVLRGPGIRPGRYDRAVVLNDLAPTLATLLDVETPSGSVGRVLDEALLPVTAADRP